MKRILLFLLFFTSITVLSQDRIYTTDQYRMSINKGTYIQFSSRDKAMDSAIAHKLKYPNDRVNVKYTEQLNFLFNANDDLPYKTEYIGNDWSGLANMKVIDTITLEGFKYGNISSKNNGVINAMGVLIVVDKDSTISIPTVKNKMKLERLKVWPDAETKYRLISINN